MERIDALGDMTSLVVRGFLVCASHVSGDRLELGEALFAQFVVEGFEHFVVLAFSSPHDGSVGVVVGDDGQIPVSLSVGDLVHADAVQVVQTSIVDGLHDHIGHDLGHRLPGDPQQLGNCRLVSTLGKPGNDILEVAGMACPRPCPGNLLGYHFLAAPTVDPADLGFKKAPGGTQIEVAPPAHGTVVGGPGLETTWTAVLAPLTPNPNDDAFRSIRSPRLPISRRLPV